MSIKLEMRLVPYGSSSIEDALLITAEFYTVPFGREPQHGFRILDNTGKF